MSNSKRVKKLYKVMGDHQTTGSCMSLLRWGKEEADKTAKFMVECGYVNVEVVVATWEDTI